MIVSIILAAPTFTFGQKRPAADEAKRAEEAASAAPEIKKTGSLFGASSAAAAPLAPIGFNKCVEAF